MVKRLMKGKKGAQANFVTRSKAVRKLQLKLSDFRKLCILKGIYPREPKKHPKGKDKVYYHIKDIRFLAHEKLLGQFREVRAFTKKIKKALGRGEKERAQQLKGQKPQLSVSHLVKERYPSFIDAIRDLDDPLCLLSLYSVLPAHKLLSIDQKSVQKACQVMREFNLWVIKSQSLRKVFLSIKGIYYQAEVQGQLVTWVVPYQFTQKLPPEVDYKIMNTFLHFYTTLTKFVNFKLYSSLGYHYPPKIDCNSELNIYNTYKAFLLQNKTQDTNQVCENKFKIDQEFADTAEVQQILGNQNYQGKDILKGLVFWLNREVPRYALEFVLLAFGGEVYWDDGTGQMECDSPGITHVVVDRPKEHLNILADREYVQPQWVFDSVNNQTRLPVSQYAPGKPLPPHLSPFVDNQKEQYIPQRQKEIDGFKDITGHNQPIIQQSDQEEEQQEEEISEQEYQHEKEQKKIIQKEKKNKQEQLDMSQAVMSKKNRNIMKRINYGKEQKKKEAEKLKDKAKKVKKAQ